MEGDDVEGPGAVGLLAGLLCFTDLALVAGGAMEARDRNPLAFVGGTGVAGVAGAV